MLSVFPIMFLSLLAHAILRTMTGGVLCVLAVRHLRASASSIVVPKRALVAIATAELLVGVLLFIGLFTQVAALVTLCLAAFILARKSSFASVMPSPSFFVLLIGVSLSLVITGAGAFAFDMPF